MRCVALRVRPSSRDAVVLSEACSVPLPQLSTSYRSMLEAAPLPDGYGCTSVVSVVILGIDLLAVAVKTNVPIVTVTCTSTLVHVAPLSMVSVRGLAELSTLAQVGSVTL
jgi:hypothetical protein